MINSLVEDFRTRFNKMQQMNLTDDIFIEMKYLTSFKGFLIVLVPRRKTFSLVFEDRLVISLV